jgi:dTMP kinase
MKGIFITFEGVEGSGKTTQLKLLAEHIKKSGRDVLVTMEPGGTAIGNEIRRLLLDPKNTNMMPIAELLLYEAARAQHVLEKIRPAIQDGKVVISDRFSDATYAYQGAARKIPRDIIDRLELITTGGLKPDLTFLLDIEASCGLKRAIRRNEEEKKRDRFEDEMLEFHERVRKGYLELAALEPSRIKVIDASGTVEETFKKVLAVYNAFLSGDI